MSANDYKAANVERDLEKMVALVESHLDRIKNPDGPRRKARFRLLEVRDAIRILEVLENRLIVEACVDKAKRK